jgi:hypothetical protein
MLRSLLAIVLSDADRLEALRVLVAAEPCRESWETVACRIKNTDKRRGE